MIQSPEVQSKIALIRHKLAEGTATTDDLREGVRLMREGRLSAVASSDSAKRKRAIAAVPNADDLLGELGSL